MSPSPGPDQPKVLARACQFCRVRKIRCDTAKPSCGTCVSQRRQCNYVRDAPKQRPSTAVVRALQGEKKALQNVIVSLKQGSPDQQAQVLDSIEIRDGSPHLPRQDWPVDLKPESEEGGAGGTSHQSTRQRQELGPRASISTSGQDGSGDAPDDGDDTDEDAMVDASMPSSRKDQQLGLFGSTSANQGPPANPLPEEPHLGDAARYQLIANATIQRQKEYRLRQLHDIDGVPMELVMHLLDLHWHRQHHTFLLTYRPAIMRDLVQGGPGCSRFLFYAILACTSKYSERVSLRSDPSDPATAGGRFFERCEELLARDNLLSHSTVPTIVGLLLLGSTLNSRGEISKSWLYTGYAIRMVYDLGLVLDDTRSTASIEEIEIRRRVFWGAFICDKLQSLYLGRPAAIQLRDAHVSTKLLDTSEEMEMWTPYVDSQSVNFNSAIRGPLEPTPIYSVSAFQQMCLLSRIMTRIINCFYAVGAPTAKAGMKLQSTDQSLIAWRRDLPADLVFEPWSDEPVLAQRSAPPNVIILHATYWSLVILLHRPFISDNHLRSAGTPANSWKRCTAAARHITSIVLTYRSIYALRGAPYLMGYTIYVACTIHVRNAAAVEGSRGGEHTSLLQTSLQVLDELTTPNSGISKPAKIIRGLMATNGLSTEPVSNFAAETPSSLDLDAILAMFPNSAPQIVPDSHSNYNARATNTTSANMTHGQEQGNQDPPFPGSFGEPDLYGQDLLFGFMREPYASSQNVFSGFNGMG